MNRRHLITGVAAASAAVTLPASTVAADPSERIGELFEEMAALLPHVAGGHFAAVVLPDGRYWLTTRVAYK